MEKYISAIARCPLFSGVKQTQVMTLLSCLCATVKRYEKNALILTAGQKISAFGMLLFGGAHIVKEDYWGNRDIISPLGPGDLFAEAFAYAQPEMLPVSVVAAEDTVVLLMDYRKIVKVCPSVCSFHTLLIQNMLGIIAEKNIMLMQKIEHISKRSTREKLLSYLSAQAQRQKSNIFDIPFNRQQLADYLSVDRSAMSAALCRLRDEGILAFYRNRFEIKS